MKIVFKSITAKLLLAVSIVSIGAGILPVLAQNATARGGGTSQAPDTPPPPEPDMAVLIKNLGLVESKLPAREFIKGWRRPKKILVMVDNNTHRLDWMKEVVPADVQLIAVKRNDQDFPNELKDADAIVGGMCTKQIVNDVGPNFHWLHSSLEGVEGCFTGDVPARLKDGTVAVTNSQKTQGAPVGEHAIALTVALSRGLDQYSRMDVTGQFTTEPYPRLWSLQGRTILIAGLGGVGMSMATLAHGLGMRVIATNGSIPADAPDYIEHIGLPNELGDMVGQADVVMTALPLTNQTTHLFDAAMFAKFKKGAIFINVTREEEQVDADLAAALESGQISSTGQDSVVPDSPLWKEKNIIITPHVAAHVAAQSVEPMLGSVGEMGWAVAREDLRRYVTGDKLLSVVDPVKGY